MAYAAGERSRVRAFLLYGNMPVGLIAVGFMLGTYALLGLPPSPPLLLLALCGCFLVYQLERTAGFAPEDRFNQPGRLAWLGRHRCYVRSSSLLAVVGGLMVLPALRPATIGLCVGLGLLSLLYAAPVLPGKRRLKTVWFLKPLLISGGWAIGGVVLPVVEAGAPLGASAAAMVLYRFGFVLPNALFADWPDRAGDARAGLHTVATRLSTRQLQGLAVSVLAAVVAGGLAARASGAPALLYVDLGGPALMLASLLHLRPRTRWFYGFVLDVLVAWPVFTFIVAWL